MSWAHIIGVSVSEMIAEIMTATLSVTANSRNRRPTTPPIRSSGRNTATSETVRETTVKPISLAPLSAAWTGGRPRSRCRAMFSIMMMASSTTKPAAIVSAISERLFRL